MKPVASRKWLEAEDDNAWWKYMDTFDGNSMLAKPCELLFTADQLRQAKVEVLREAADRLMNCGEEFGAKHLHIMADEIGKGDGERIDDGRTTDAHQKL